MKTPPTARLVRLDEAGAQKPALVGAKAARLAAARARGLPVLDGLVVTVDVSVPLIEAGTAVLRSTGNSGAARSAVYNHRPPTLLLELADRGRTLGDSLVVRSSSRAEAEGVWAGAFSSYLGVSPGELTRGVIGCWASIFNPHTLKRGEVTGTSPPEVGMAVLVQPEIRPACGGVATIAEDGGVTVVGGPGHPAGLVSGWERGHTATVTPRGQIRADPSPLGPGLLRRIADLAGATAAKTGWNHIEWMTDQQGRLYLVQAQSNVDPGLSAKRTRALHTVPDLEPWMSEVVRMMIRYPGPVGEKLVWSWAVGLADLSPAPAQRPCKPAANLVEDIRGGHSLLMSQRWEGVDRSTQAEPAWSALLDGDSSPLSDLISRRASIDRTLAGAHLRNLRELGRVLTDAGAIPHPGWMWYLDPDNLDPDTPDRPRAMSRVGVGKWDPWIYSVINSRGNGVAGIPAAGAWGVGRLRFIGNAEDAARFSPREVIAASQPVGNIAPLLWNAAGLITAEGSPAAHLFEVAQWLGVPAVCGVDISRWTRGNQEHFDPPEGLIAAVDGERGDVTLLSLQP